MDTNEQYDAVVEQCRKIFVTKTKDYGTAWRVLRPISIIDQIYIKAQRIRNIQEIGTQMVEDHISSEFVGIINYSLIGLIQLELTENDPEELDAGFATEQYDRHFLTAKHLMRSKNHDYGEAWRNMSQQSFVDLILMKLQRMRQIIGNEGQTLASEGLDANYLDIINYSVFALILMNQKQHS